MAPPDVGDLGQVRLRGRELAKHLAGMSGEDVTGVGGHHATGMPLQQRLADLPFKALELLRDRRRCVGEHLGRSGHGAAFDDVHQNL